MYSPITFFKHTLVTKVLYLREFNNECRSAFCLRSIAALFIAMFLIGALSVANGATFTLNPTGMTDSCSEELENVWNSAQPGDEIILNEGIYAQGCARRINNNGTAANPIIVRAADGADVLITRPLSSVSSKNNIEIQGSYMEIRGLRFQYGSQGVRFMSSSNIVFEDNEVFDMNHTAFTMNSGSTDNFVIRNNHIHHAGIAGGSTGEGMYIGCHSGNCTARDHLIEGNHIHDLQSNGSGCSDGIELKFNSHSNIVRGNEVYNTSLGSSACPCTFSYGHEIAGGEPNIIENNLLYNCAEGVLATSDTIIRNNVILDTTYAGIHIRYQAPTATGVENITVVNNTVYGSHPTCGRFNTNGSPNVTIANNSFYCAGSTAIAGGLGSPTLLNNYVDGGMSASSIDNVGFFDGGLAADQFVNPAGGDFHLKATSILIDAGNDNASDLPTEDYDGNIRSIGAAVDVGAFEYGSGSGPSNPVVTLSIDDSSVTTGDDVTLTYTISNADSCNASSSPASSFSGAITPANGSQMVNNLQADITFTLMCSNTDGNTTRDVSVTVSDPIDYQLYNDDDGNYGSGAVLLSSLGDLLGTLYVQVLPETDIQSVTFEIDDTQVGAVELTAPYVLGGSSYDSVSLTDGAHTLSATVQHKDGTVVLTQTITIANGGKGDPLPTLTLTATPQSITAGQTSLLNWSTTDATICDGQAGLLGTLAAFGSQTVTPTVTTTYTLECTGPGGMVTESVIVTVTAVGNDTDQDGLPDDWEIANFGNLDQSPSDDADNDGFTNLQEFAAGSDPTDANSSPDDLDGDGLDDAWEIANFGSLNETATGDPDNDGYTNLEELNAGTNPLNIAETPVDTDADGMLDADELMYFGNLSQSAAGDFDTDGITNAMEIANGTNPALADTDSDGLSDMEEFTHGTDPLDPDSDNDGYSDGSEIIAGSNPNDASDTPATIPPDDNNDSGGGATTLWFWLWLNSLLVWRRYRKSS
ncbi:MAG: hypothetical protein HKM24_05270 [Gammaproteobacteria bacterium]|nr:hypothetical protein [Gammaproteobacteria bacterium]